MKKIVIGIAALGVAALMLAGCSASEPSSRQEQLSKSQQKQDKRTPPDVTGDTEYNNYIKAQEEIYDDPSTILWCTVFPQSPNMTAFTVPIQGKLTSSSTSYYPSQTLQESSEGSFGTEENQSVDGMYHGSPPPYRYGFTPSGQYVDFTDLPTFCTTVPTEFQKQTLAVKYDGKK